MGSEDDFDVKTVESCLDVCDGVACCGFFPLFFLISLSRLGSCGQQLFVSPPVYGSAPVVLEWFGRTEMVVADVLGAWL